MARSSSVPYNYFNHIISDEINAEKCVLINTYSKENGSLNTVVIQ